MQPTSINDHKDTAPAAQPDAQLGAELQPSTPKAPPARRNARSTLLRDLMVSFLISTFIILFLYQPVRVEGTSMMPGLENDDRLFINKYAYRLHPVERNDIVVFLFPRDRSKSYIKRVIGVPGDDVRIDAGQVYVNGVALREPYVPQEYADDHSMPELRVPAGQYFVLGDHRSVASDSRDFGTVPRALIYGKADFVYWPMDQAGMVR